jgi:hypothetical protein
MNAKQEILQSKNSKINWPGKPTRPFGRVDFQGKKEEEGREQKRGTKTRPFQYKGEKAHNWDSCLFYYWKGI